MNKTLNVKQIVVLDVFGLILLIFGLAAFVHARYINFELIFWFCYLGMILIGVGLLTTKSNLILSQLNILMIPFIIWNLDFFYQLFTERSLFGVTDYVFVNGDILGKIISLQHVFTLIFAVYGLYVLGIEKNKLWQISFLQGVLIFFLTRIFTSDDSNINCVFRSCMSFSLEPYVFYWFLVLFIMVFLSDFVLERVFEFCKGMN